MREEYGDLMGAKSRREFGLKEDDFITSCNGLSTPCAIKGEREEVSTIGEDEVLSV